MVKVKEIEDSVLALFEQTVRGIWRTEAIKKIGKIKKGRKVTYYVTIQQ